MASDRPTIDPALLASMIEAAPGRVRRRLDKDPNIAESWSWNPNEDGFAVAAGEEAVEIRAPDGVVRAMDQLTCSCLLAPKCHHILACVSVLSIESEDDRSSPSDSSPAKDVDKTTGEAVATVEEISPEMYRAASLVRQSSSEVLRVGARASGALIQSSLLRASHTCRAASLPMLGNAVLRIAESIRLLRGQSDVADSAALRNDLFVALLATETLRSGREVPPWVVGTSRREFHPVSVARLQGWFAEPILTRSGYAGICVHLLAPDGEMFQVTDLRPGDSSLVKQAYKGGIDLGTITMSGSELARQDLAVQNLTAASDGRLGKGKSTRWARQGEVGFAEQAAQARLAMPLPDQLDRVFQVATLPADMQRGGWDLIAFDAQVLGANGPALMVQLGQVELPWQLRIAIDGPALTYRENMELLARCPGLRLRCVGRVRVEAAGQVDLLAIGPVEENAAGEDDQSVPCLRLPDDWYGRCNLGIDRLERHHVNRVSRWGVEVHLDDDAISASDDGLAELDRRLSAVVLGGYRAVPNIESAAHRRAHTALRRYGHASAAQLLDLLAASAASAMHTTAAPGTGRSGSSQPYDDILLACATYLQSARSAFHHQRWKQLL